ncbi:MAG TPA: alpha/beta hydrolase [Phycisphaerae bacterium]|nr:alpha/beta hydrolase [Phycisphaerae bacterium]
MRKQAAVVGIVMMMVFASGCRKAKPRKSTAAPQGSTAPITVKELQQPGPGPEEMVYRTVGGRQLRIFVFKPPNHDPADQRAAVVSIHGGGWQHGDPELLDSHCRYFASRGAVAVNVQYRLVTPEAIRIDDCTSDCKAAVRFLRANAGKLGIDPHRIAVLGESAGGQLAAATGMLPDFEKPDQYANVSSRADALLLYNPCLDLPAIDWMKGNKAVQPLPAAAPPDTQTWEDRARKFSPMSYVKSGTPPTLLVHGAEDKIVPVEQIDRFDKAMKAAGNRCDYHRMPGWNHAFLIPNYGTEDQIVQALRIADRFLVSLDYLQGEPTIKTVSGPAGP